MGLFQGCAAAGALVLAVSAWMLAGGVPDPHPLWPYLLFGTVFVVLLAHVIRIILDEMPAVPAALLNGVPLVIAAYFLGDTAYRWLEYACWVFAVAYLLFVPRMMRAIVHARHDGGRPHARTQRGFDLRDISIAMFVVIAISGIILCTEIAAREWGFYAGVGALLLSPVTLTAVPWYAAIAHGEWLPVAVVYGGGIAAFLLHHGARMQRRHDAPDIGHSETGSHR